MLRLTRGHFAPLSVSHTLRRQLSRIPPEVIRDRVIANHLTMDHLPRPIVKWEDYWPKRRRFVNAVFTLGVTTLVVSAYLTSQLGILGEVPFRLPFHLVGHEPFPGFRYDDVTDEDVDRMEGVDTPST